MYDQFSGFLKDKKSLCIIQAENPDGDSLGSALGLEEILASHTPQISLYCPVTIPKYLHYFTGWDRISQEFDFSVECYIIVDTASKILLSKLLDDPAIRDRLYSAPVLIIDHHETADDLDFSHTAIIEPLPSCTNLIYKIANDQKLPVSAAAAQYLLGGLLSDTLGLTTASVTADTFRAVAGLVDCGANPSELDRTRREFMKKSQRILAYKADLIQHIEYSLEGLLATVHIPWEEISEYSDEYNPGVLIIDELRMVQGVELAIAIKTYPDGKLTGKIRADLPIADQLAGYFGGGGHPYAAGFRTYDTTYTETIQEIIKILPKLIKTLSNEDLADLTPAQRAALGLENSSEPTPATGNGIKGLEKLL